MPAPMPNVRLGRLAQLLNAERSPYYVRQPLPPGLRATFSNEGWYWIPPGGTQVEFIARDAFDAYHKLMCLIEAQTAEQEAAA